jgi:hypothetical protein
LSRPRGVFWGSHICMLPVKHEVRILKVGREGVRSIAALLIPNETPNGRKEEERWGSRGGKGGLQMPEII